MTTFSAETTELLMKTRKDAWASFGLKHWTLVLEAVGFKVEITDKVRTTVFGVKITDPAGNELKIVKEPGYRRILFYDLPSWARGNGFALPKMASRVLGLPTIGEERALKDLYVRDLTNTGTCPVCEGNFKRASDGGLVHHGYQRPGDGAIVGDCFAVAYQPWELSPKGAVDFLAQVLRSKLKNAENYLARLKAGEVTEFTEIQRDRTTRQNVIVKITKNDGYRFESKLSSAIHSTEREVEMLGSEIARFEKRIGAWKEDVLPEIKHAGKFFRR